MSDTACVAFAWIGQSFAYCDNCSRPAWEHDGYETTKGDPFTLTVPLRRARWKETHITSWLENGYISEERAEELRNAEEFTMAEPPQRHSIDLDTDIDTGEWIAGCSCGWTSPSFVEQIDATRAFGAHIEEVAS